ncbi:hypothetical protein F904_01427 [Acinetobacter dispersus]|uniref:Uncharacterized protein n=1 Tax=Acinetobacter dispersus TaxID=70348 RepID=N9MRI4_9GAMM|nr:hypothetical protein F904_01427 [Acinetobacter dispersus]
MLVVRLQVASCNPVAVYIDQVNPNEKKLTNDKPIVELCPIYLGPNCKHTFSLTELKLLEKNKKRGPVQTIIFDFL